MEPTPTAEKDEIHVEASEEFIEKVKKMWRDLSPCIDVLDEKIIEAYIQLGPSTPYRVAKHLGESTASIYRRSRRLLFKRYLVPSNDGDTLEASVKSCIALYARGRMGFDVLQGCVRRIWGLSAGYAALHGFLYLLGLEAARRSLTLQTLTMCRADEASLHVVRYLREVIAHHVASGGGFAAALDRVAELYSVPPAVFREALRLALLGLGRTAINIVADGDHAVALISSGGRFYYFAIACRNPCQEYYRSLGLGCPHVSRLLARRLSEALHSLPV